MIIDGIHANGEGVRAAVRWENSGREPLDLYVRGTDLVADANGLLLLAFLPAWKAGEHRIVVDGGVCPVLRANLDTVSQLLSRWHGLADAPAIEAQPEVRLPKGEVGLFLSGGIDSLASLRTGQQRVPKSHPDAVSTAILVAGSTSEARLRELQRIHGIVSQDAGVRSVVLRTSAQSLHRNDAAFYMRVYHGAFLAGLAYFLSDRLRKVRISASFDAANLEPWGSHPLLDQFYGSAHMTVEHHGLEMTRLAKTAVVADWPVGLAHMNVCISPEGEGRNCGKCEKCHRTMLALVCLDKLKATNAFGRRDIQPADLDGLRILPGSHQNIDYGALLEPLRLAGRADLAAVLERKMAPETKVRRAMRRGKNTLRSFAQKTFTAKHGPSPPPAACARPDASQPSRLGAGSGRVQ